jgi:hypothetical protein
MEKVKIIFPSEITSYSLFGTGPRESTPGAFLYWKINLFPISGFFVFGNQLRSG